MGLDFLTSVTVAVKLAYQLACPAFQPTDFPGLHAELNLSSRKIRLELAQAIPHLNVALSQEEWESLKTKGIEKIVSIPTGQKCSLTSIEADEIPLSQDDELLALEHAPYLIVRRDQVSNRDTDLPLLLTYRLESMPSGGRALLYTIYFSAEDSKKSLQGSEAMMGDAGRRLDIEWIYRVEWNKHGEIITRQYQGGVFLGVGHSTKNFNGRFLPGTQNPILYNIATHNVFSDRVFDQSNSVGHALLPVAALKSPYSREEIVFKNYPWMIHLSDRESLRENACLYTSDRYLYVQFAGTMKKGFLKARLELENGYTETSGSGYGSVKGFGEGEAYTAVPTQSIGSELGIAQHGRVTLIGTAMSEEDIALKGLRFFSFGSELAEITERFRCTGEGLQTECVF